LFEKKDGNSKIPDVGVRDTLFEKTQGVNEFFLDHSSARNFLLIVCSGNMDVLSLASFLRWGFLGDSWRVILAAIMFYGFRFAIQDIWFV